MRFLLITNREIRARSRRPAVYWLRVAAGVLGILMCVPDFILAPPPPALLKPGAVCLMG